MSMTAEQTTRIEKMENELHEQRQIFIQGKLFISGPEFSGPSEPNGGYYWAGFYRTF